MYRRFYGLLTTDMGFKYIISHCIVCHFKNCSCLLCLLLRGAYGTISQSLPNLSSFFLPRYITVSLFFSSLFFPLDRFSPALSWAIYSRTYRSPLVFLNSRRFKKKLFHLRTCLSLRCEGQGRGVGTEQGWEKAAGGARRWEVGAGDSLAVLRPYPGLWGSPWLSVRKRSWG